MQDTRRVARVCYLCDTLQCFRVRRVGYDDDRILITTPPVKRPSLKEPYKNRFSNLYRVDKDTNGTG